MRRKLPTGSSTCSATTGKKRRNKTMQAAKEIHGGSQEDRRPATQGLLETVDRKCSEAEIINSIGSCKKLKGKVFPKVYKKDLQVFESSTDNMLRSIAVYYSKGVMGRVKYRSDNQASGYKYSNGRKKSVRISVANCPTPRIVPYHKLMTYMKSIDIG